MIDDYCHTPEWIHQKRHEFGNVDPRILEKAIKALALLDALSIESVNFIFKGGTALLLLLPNPQRLSIDIDIILEEYPDTLSNQLDNLILNSIFHRWEEDFRENAEVPARHYKFYYESLTSTGDEDHIILDTLAGANPYPVLLERDLQSNLIKHSGTPSQVRMPDIDGILGDKLTAFAPQTIGIQFGSAKEQEIIKQLFDIGVLFDQASDLNTVHQSFNATAESEIKYRSINITPNKVLEDTFQAALILAFRGKIRPEHFNELKMGVHSVASHLLTRYTMEDAIISSAKAAYLSMLLNRESEKMEYFDPHFDLRRVNIEHRYYNKLNKLKKSQPEAFFYWYKAISLM